MIFAISCLSSYSLTVFSPSGKLVQIEHALAVVAQGTTSLGIKGNYKYLLQPYPGAKLPTKLPTAS